MQLLNDRVQLAQIFAPAFFRLQFPFAHKGGEISDFMHLLTRQVTGGGERSGVGRTFGEIDFKMSAVSAQRGPQVPPKLLEFLDERLGRRGIRTWFRHTPAISRLGTVRAARARGS